MSLSGIFILGSQNFQHQILAHYLEHERGIPCRILPPDCEFVSASVDTKGGSPLFLIDCSETGVERYFMNPQPAGGLPPFRHAVSIFNARRDSGIEEKALQTGVKGIFYEGLPLEVFIEGILEILNGGIWFPEDLMVKWISSQRKRVILPVKEKPFLSSREIEIIGKLAMGLTNDDIADHLHISLFTVKTHLQNIYRKIKVTNRMQAIIWASKHLAGNRVDLSWLGEGDVERKAVGHH
ncbi:MAG TPA: response regulator transcription factor [Syntrophales bacterium]|nr:response regulator transcription factor [Syntrophales bacterium]HOX94022.1 response regulator transcription factor [Syntrophales bacterium]HPI58304.1 response regulator transcription factor [Syntrophales bacterium]HPN26122.1 response regulator transcription factor [Syntrophales bacterium]HQM30499.1 response regulator transcription factor [Syntrophales bacterium]